MAAVAATRRHRAPLLELGEDSLRAIVPLKRTGLRITAGVLSLLFGGLITARILAVFGYLVAIRASPVVFLLMLPLLLVFDGPGLFILASGAYNLWGVQVATVAGGEASVRFELWGKSYRHSRILVGPGATVEVLGERSSEGSVHISGYRHGSGLRSASLSFGAGSLTRAEAEHIASRIRETMEADWLQHRPSSQDIQATARK